MGYLDAATRWSVGLWLAFGLCPTVLWSLPWASWVKDEKLAAWVQAVGSIVAIVVAFLAVVIAHALSVRHARQEQREARNRRLAGARNIIKKAHAQIGYCANAYIGKPVPTGDFLAEYIWRSTQLRAIADALRQIDVTELENFEQATAIATAISNIDTASTFLHSTNASASDREAFAAVLDRAFRRFNAELEFSMKSLEEQAGDYLA